MVLGVGALGLCGAFFLPRSPQDRLAAFLGVAESIFSGVVALGLKRRALARSVKGALAVVGQVFFLRMVLVAAGLVFVARAQWGAVAFTLGFFGVYFPLLWVEVGCVLVEAWRRGWGGGGRGSG